MRNLIALLAVLVLSGLAYGQGIEGQLRRLYNVERGNSGGYEVMDFTKGFLLNGSALSLTELGFFDGVTAGTVTASKGVAVDSNKDIGDFRNLDAVNVDAGASGTAGTVDIFPSTASKGKVAITAADSAGNTTTTIVNASQSGARTYTIPDAGASGGFVLTTATQKVFGMPHVRLNSSTAASTAFTAAVEANFSTGSYTIPASTLAAGDVITVDCVVTIPTTDAADTLRIYLNVGGISGTAIFDSTALDVSNDDKFRLRATINVRTVGATGTMYCLVEGTATVAGADAVAYPTLTSIGSIDTTAAIDLTVSAVWSDATGNSCSLQFFNVNLN